MFLLHSGYSSSSSSSSSSYSFRLCFFYLFFFFLFFHSFDHLLLAMADGGVPGGPDWQGLLKWSLSHSDGTAPPRRLRYSRLFFFSYHSRTHTNTRNKITVFTRDREFHALVSLPLAVTRRGNGLWKQCKSRLWM